MSDRLRGKVAIVTGSGQGIGRAIALAMAKEGARVVTNDLPPRSISPSAYGEKWLSSLSRERREFVTKRSVALKGNAETAAEEIVKMGGEAVPYAGDISNFEIADKLTQTAIEKFGKLDILVNNAGTFRRGPIWEVTPEDWDAQMNSMLKGTFNCTRHACPLMKEQGSGRIINVTSGAWLGTIHHSAYSAAKGGIVSFTRSVAVDLYPYGITCNAIAPGAGTRALISNLAYSEQSADAGTPVAKAEWIDTLKAATGPQAILPPEAVAPLVVYLATEEAATISGVVLTVRAGHVALYSEPAQVKAMDKKDGWWTVDELVEKIPEVLLEGYQNLAAAAQP